MVCDRFQRWIGRRNDASGVYRGWRSFARHPVLACNASFIRQQPSSLDLCIGQLRAFMRLSLTPVTIEISPTD
jgi:hypothetical protein